ncbi:MAG: bifunctional demethylmenaquinone methyltransferase/2-methoxy-6-polyprenyl-1,4-benzoquinol methylase UbiE [candidate division Zixibacteria bacterium]|nr:bifunctional demethylmenaquinone methyltransferase/2-methoxy-6-polyprenyl-1,4-benzoquinol methylase UbiE [candidate division Zixibacteria bacterium]
MFDRIARRYDLLNHLLSFGFDFYWRRRAVKNLDKAGVGLVIDLACGTGDLSLAAARTGDCNGLIVGIDMAGGMLKLAGRKISARNLNKQVKLLHANAMALPLQDNCADAVMIAFGIRNMPDTVACLSEICRVLKPSGRAIVLEFSLPENRLIRTLYLPYLRWILPHLGRMISGDRQAYTYLDKTVETYCYGDEFVRLMKDADFANIALTPLTGGIVTIYTGEKRDL